MPPHEPRLQRTPSDPWLTRRLRAATAAVELELAIRDAILAALAETMAELWRIVLSRPAPKSLTAAGPPDVSGMEQARNVWVSALERFLRPIIQAVFGDRWQAILTSSLADRSDVDVARMAHVAEVENRLSEPYWRQVLNRLSATIDPPDPLRSARMSPERP